jgi:hypothetical protein
MNRIARLLRPILSSLLISLLIGAQTISLAHASEHDAGLSQDSCAICVGSSQISAAAVDNGPIHAERFFGPVLCSHRHIVPATTSKEIPRQRGPPAQL